MKKGETVRVFLDTQAQKIWSTEYDTSWSYLNFESLESVRLGRGYGTDWDKECPATWAVYMEYLDSKLKTGIYEVTFRGVSVRSLPGKVES